MILKLMIVHVGRPEWLTRTGSRFTIAAGFYDRDHWPLLPYLIMMKYICSIVGLLCSSKCSTYIPSANNSSISYL